LLAVLAVIFYSLPVYLRKGCAEVHAARDADAGQRRADAEPTRVNISRISAAAWDVPMRAPYRSAQRITTTARNVLVTVILADGTTGYGESAPATYVTGETQDSVVAALNAAIAAVSVTEATAAELLPRFAPHLATSPGGYSALTCALLDAEARAEGVPLYRKLYPGAGPTSEPSWTTDLSLPILTPDEARVRAAQAASDGFRALKIKVGCGDPVEDEARVRAIAEAAPAAKLRLDGNQGFTGESAVAFVDRLADLVHRIEMFEQPTKAGDDAAMGFVQRRIPIPVFADESVHHPEDVERLLGSLSCHGVVLKLAKSDPLTVVDIGLTVHVYGGMCLFGCMMETHIGISAALHAAIALGSGIVPMLDLDGHLLTNDAGLVNGGFTQEGDVLTVAEGVVGLGVTLAS